MSDTQKQDSDEALESQEVIAGQDVVDSGEVADSGEEEQPKLNLDVKIESRSACERHITVTVPREDIDRYFDKE